MSGEPSERREQVIRALIAAGAAGVSGEDLAQRLGCSRAAIHRQVDAIRRDGTPIDGGATGYRLGPGADPVVGAMVTERLSGPLRGPVEWVPHTGSTNDDVLQRARAGAPEGLVIGADAQSAGRGRRGRQWQMAPAIADTLMLSVLLRPAVAPIDAALLPIVAAVAVAQAIGPQAQIKWPNDILIDGRKVVGILCEMSADQERVQWAVVGIGINLRAAPQVDDGRWQPGAIGPGAPGRHDLAVAVIDRLGHNYADWVAVGPAGVLECFAQRDYLNGRQVAVSVGDRTVEGWCDGLDDLGRLRVRDADGVSHPLGAGEVTRVAQMVD